MGKFNILSGLISWILPTREDRYYLRDFFTELDNRENIKFIQSNYNKIIQKLKNRQRKLKVLFLVNENSKWKAQSLYDLMLKSEDFEPVIALTIADIQRHKSKDIKKQILKENTNFFAKRDVPVIYAWNTEKDSPISPKEIKADIVFYQQPWGLAACQKPQNVGKYALTCYIPYYLPNYGKFSMDCKLFHKYLFRYYVLNKNIENMYKNYLGSYGDNIYATGHTMLDEITNNFEYNEKYNDCVIYAPHWSIAHPKNQNSENYATFDKFGNIILEYAKSHPEVNWVFKPHPTLKSVLLKTGIMTEEQVEQYYNEWENVGKACYNGDYTTIFQNSKAMITDCGSFLVEYFCTQKPLIYLTSEKCSITPIPQTAEIIETFYKVGTKEDLFSYLDQIILKNEDTMKQNRLELLKRLDILNSNAAQNILNDLRESIKS